MRSLTMDLPIAPRNIATNVPAVDDNDESINIVSEPSTTDFLGNEARPSSSSTQSNQSDLQASSPAMTTTATATMSITMPDRSSWTGTALSIKKLRTSSPPSVFRRSSTTTTINSNSNNNSNNNNNTSFSPSSDFSLELMPVDRIQKRTLYAWSVHHSIHTSKWIATIARACPSIDSGTSGSNAKLRFVQFLFTREREAIKFCKSYAPPKLIPATQCFSCKKPGTYRHCRNCGAPCCEADSTRWCTHMLPKTYTSDLGSGVVRVCKACDWLSNAFCLALLRGRAQDAVRLYETGNINLRSSFADIHREAMFPVHCAVMGGSLECLKWLVDTQMCPISVKVDPKTSQPLSVQTSAKRTLLDLSMTGRPKIDILTYLVGKGLSINDMKQSDLALKTLEVLLKSPMPATPARLSQQTPVELHLVEETCEEMDIQSVGTMTTVEDACIICFERNMDCVLTPCGHQVCCTECGKQLDKCPVCKAACSFLKIYRQ